MPDYLFCKIIAGDRPSKKVFEDEYVYAFHDINPVAPIHVLIIPKKHISMINDVKATDAETMGRLFVAAKNISKKLGVADDGYRTVMNCGEAALQSIYHVHLHLLAGRNLSWPPG